jgi:hypothetical protein
VDPRFRGDDECLGFVGLAELVTVQDQVCVFSGVILPSIDHGWRVYRFIFLLECGVEPKGIVRLATPIKHPVEAAAM